MPRKSEDVPDALKPYRFHGLDLSPATGGQHTAECPWCGSSKWFVNSETTQWDCKVCGEKGNVTTFLKKLWHDDSADRMDEYDALATDRGLDVNTLIAWGVKFSPLTNEPILPGYGDGGKFVNLYRYVKDKTGKRVLLSTTGLKHGVHRPDGFDEKAETVYLCEGPWDGMRLYEVLSSYKAGDGDSLVPTSNVEASLLRGCAVLAVPGCNVFDERWTSLLAGKDVTILFDSDHPRKHPQTGAVLEPVGWAASRRVTNVLASAEQPPRSISVLKWGEEGYDPSLKSGTDVRDVLADPVDGLNLLKSRVVPIPADWIGGRSLSSRKSGGTELECLPCTSWKELVSSWRKSMKWTEGLDRALSVMLSCVVSTKLPGDQLWVKIVAEPSSGKSVLCEALAVSKKHVLANSTLRGFHSGFKTDKGGEEDNSLAKMLKDKTLVTKDGDTLLQSPNLEQIFSEARDLYDRVSRTSYRNGINRSYDQAMTWIIAGTPSIRVMDTSELGERFLDCVVDPVDEDTERIIQRRKMDSLMTNIHDTSLKNSGDSPEMVKSKQLTGGYIDHLKEKVSELLSAQVVPEEAVEKCMDLALFVAYMRARPSIKQDETAGRELSIRLTSQLGRLMMVMGVVLNRPTIDDEVMRRVSRVATDTARGHTMEMVGKLFEAGDDGMDSGVLANKSNMTPEKTRTFLRFLSRIGVVELFQHEVVREAALDSGTARKGILGNGTKPRWRLTAKLRRLYDNVMKGI